MAQHHHNGAVRIHPLGHAEVVDAVVGDDVCQVVLWGEQRLAHQSVGEREGQRQSLLKRALLW